ncbi:MAG: ABC transporter permease, partial [Sedimentisphaerales bacterium]|nr:ABC transporter permease [Sedimentisphaerales bacterium]
MLKYLIKRILIAIPTLIGITLITFSTMALSPGDPAMIAAQANGKISNSMSRETYQLMRKEMLLDKPIMLRYWYWLAGHPATYAQDGITELNPTRPKGILNLDFGISLGNDRRPVAEKIFGEKSFWQSRFWATMSLAFLAIGSSLLLAVPIGIIQAVKQDSLFDKSSSTFFYAMYSVPSYVLALPLILVFSIKLGWLPFQGMKSEHFAELSLSGKALDLLKHYILIAFCSSYGAWAYYSRFVRQNMLEVLRQDYIRTARAKGLSERKIIIKHAFRNTLIPLATLMGMILPAIVGGSVILETIFSWPGMGRLMYDSILIRDYNTVMALTVITAFLVLLGTLLA